VYRFRGARFFFFWIDGKLLISFVQEIIQEQYGGQLFAVLIPTLEAPEPRFVLHHHLPTAVLITLFGAGSTPTQLRHSSIFVKALQETLSFLIWIQSLNASSNFSTQLATTRNNPNVTSRNRLLPRSLWWQTQAKRLSLRCVR
jgi:hypothetical protein